MSASDDHPDGLPVAVSYLAGYIFLSYVVSTMGCATTLELLHRRTSKSGLYNWYLLFTSSVTMGGIGIWCMHFIGNRAIVLGDGAAQIQIVYSVTFTGVSFILPVVVLLAAFYAIGTSEKAGYLRIIMGGVLTGSSVCGMHYIGQLGISNYRCSYKVAHIVGAAIIAVFASTVGLVIFFRWRATWTNSWWRRGICGCLLAIAVSGMHWTAAVGTSYKGHDQSVKQGGQLSRSQTVIICAVLACVSCSVLSACAIAAGGDRRRSRTKARQVVLSCAFFDPAGRVMVTPHASLPSRKIVDRYRGKTFNDDDLTRTHSAFLWAFRASRNWKLVRDVVPFMRSRIESEKAAKEHFTPQGGATDEDTEMQGDFDGFFKQHFCVTAQDLAEELRQPLQDMGVLYDDILTTTTPVSRFSRAMGYSRLSANKGQMMFTVRQLSKHEAARLAASGLRFTAIENVIPVLSRRVHIPSMTLAAHLRDMRDYATSGRNFEPGVHLVSFVMRPTVHDYFEVLTAKGVSNPLPSSSLPMKRLQIAHLELLSHMEGWTVSTCLNWLKSETARAYKDADAFRQQLIQAMGNLSSAMPPDINSASRFSARPLIAPCRSSRHSDGNNCIILPFCVVGTLDTQISNPDFTFTPLRLFRVQQQLNDGFTGGDGFAKELSQELYYSNARSSSTTDSEIASSVRALRRFWPSRKQPSDKMSATSQETLAEHSPFGEITVRKEVKVDIAKLAELSTQPTLGRHASQTTVLAGDSASGTYVDDLYNLCYSPNIRLRPDTFQQHSTVG
ncbi:MHYT domain signalling protein, putative [Aspergillus lentulus]|uniref:MHYT domain signalling protein, putative n=1 Tax=Aspergillus lentulus TaxID=293939 RepID=A0ABQ0ZUN2_ASPLE|nr:MHYT domain signalling protein, putative [Aspergillus lentulus]GFF38046.1 MHYT domain signalling protein, putative [Aspergillus lentulus]GFF46044.1 MHYT domain signalling protein, putative [Aspergillus lentulus]GFF63962.1 MHYT domain signalling protein, putative [Aspergillus lentulus]GFF65291.1 MHYT domain signalling protein, putative [Aspergillus lentulus]GFG01433.1 MHYT domain signalling protein, putative [Aspergillus lentulus]